MVADGERVRADVVVEVLRGVAELASSPAGTDVAFRRGLDLVRGLLGWPLAHVVLTAARPEGLAAEVWSRDPEDDRFERFARATEQMDFDAGTGLVGRVLAEQGPLHLVDPAEDPSFLRAAAARDCAIRGVLGFPLVAGDHAVGIVELFSLDRTPPPPDLVDLAVDITSLLAKVLERSQAAETLRATAANLAAAEALAVTGCWTWDAATGAVLWSDGMFEITGVAHTEGPVPADVSFVPVHPEDRAAHDRAVRDAMAGRRRFDERYRILRADGEVRWVRSRSVGEVGPGGELRRLHGVVQDITASHTQEQALRRTRARLDEQRQVLEDIASGLPLPEVLVRLCLQIEDAYPGGWCSVLLLDPQARVLRHAAAPSLPAAFLEAIEGWPVRDGAAACGSAAARNEVVVIADVATDPLARDFLQLARSAGIGSVWSQPLRDRRGDVVGTMALYRDHPHVPDEEELATVTAAGHLAAVAIERDRSQERLLAAASVDPLTGLPNRATFVQTLDRILEAGETPVALMFLDVDRFKWVNDSLGHGAGDDILVQVARRLSDAVGHGPLVSRFGGDEFTILLRDGEDVEALARGVEEAFTTPFRLGNGGEFFFSVSIGIARSGAGTAADDLLRDADTALYEAKEQGRSRHVVFDDRLRRRALERVRLERALRRAVDEDELVLHYQPILDLRTGRWAAVEALARWQDPERGLRPPSDFIPFAEETGLIVPVGMALLEIVISTAARWAASGRPTVVSANLSVVQLTDPGLADEVAARLARHGLDPALLVLEVTESALMEHLAAVTPTVEALVARGVRLAIDDFGTGYSSIARLGELPVAALKVDRGLSAGAGAPPRAEAVLTAVTNLAHAHGLTVVVEGIEEAVGLDAARRAGCQLAQGYHLAMPMPEAEITPYLGGSAA